MKEKFLPLGTIVTLKGASKRIMIIGYLPLTGENKMLDYSACLFPEGLLSPDKILAFNHDQINEINYKGLEDEDYIKINNEMKSIINNIDKLKETNLSSVQTQKTNNSLQNNFLGESNNQTETIDFDN